ncbi:MAG: DUF3267 domain-containing protein [Halobacteriaceae archaeon]
MTDDTPAAVRLRTDRGTVGRTAIALFVLSGALGTGLVWWSTDPIAGTGAHGVLGVVTIGVATIVVTVLGHQAVHAVVATALGYRVHVGVARNLTAVYTVAPDQHWTRTDLAVTAVAPLLLIDVAAIATIAGTPAPVAVPAVLALVTNTVGSAIDLLVLEQVVRAPVGTRFTDGGDGVMPGD